MVKVIKNDRKRKINWNGWKRTWIIKNHTI
jgi:hypothetical protein